MSTASFFEELILFFMKYKYHSHQQNLHFPNTDVTIVYNISNCFKYSVSYKAFENSGVAQILEVFCLLKNYSLHYIHIVKNRYSSKCKFWQFKSN